MSRSSIFTALEPAVRGRRVTTTYSTDDRRRRRRPRRRFVHTTD